MERPKSGSPEAFTDLTPEQQTYLIAWCQRHLDTPRDPGQPAYLDLESLKELKEHGITTEDFLDQVCRERRWLMHGSLNKFDENDQLRSKFGLIYGSNIAAVAILKSLYSNRNASLNYPYRVTTEQPFGLKIHFDPETNFIQTDRGYVYLIPRDRTFVNKPVGSWQYVSHSPSKEIRAIVETEMADFAYPVEAINDLDEHRQERSRLERESQTSNKPTQIKSSAKPPKFRNTPGAR